MTPPRKRQRTTYLIDRTPDAESDHEGEEPHYDSNSDADADADDTTSEAAPPADSPDTAWLKALYSGGAGSVTTTFASDPSIALDFPIGLLIKNFQYFRLAMDTKFLEGYTRTLHFGDENVVSLPAFATLHKWASTKAINGSCDMSWVWFREPEEREVNHLLAVAIAADYLGLDYYKELEAWLNQGLAASILEDRRVVTQEVLELVRDHEAFRSGLFWQTIVKAGVRPALQEPSLCVEPEGMGMENIGHKDGFVEWCQVLRHCQGLRGEGRNAGYAAEVLRELTETLVAGSQRGKRVGEEDLEEEEEEEEEVVRVRGGGGALMYRDPLREVLMDDPLCTDDYNGFQDFLADRMAQVLLEDRRELKRRHIVELVCNREDYSNSFGSGPMWAVAVAAAVRPFLQEHMLEIDFEKRVGEGPYPLAGHENPDMWKPIIRHCRELRRTDKVYTNELMLAVSETLAAAWEVPESDGNSKLTYIDPLAGFVFTHWPQLQHKGLKFTI